CTTPCANTACTASNCSVTISGDNVTIGNCACNVASACGSTTPNFCVAPPGSADPPENPFGIATEMLTPTIQSTVDPAQSSGQVHVFFKDDFGAGHNDTQTSQARGDVLLYGQPHVDGSADLIMDFSLQVDPMHFHFSGVDVLGD